METDPRGKLVGLQRSRAAECFEQADPARAPQGTVGAPIERWQRRGDEVSSAAHNV
ncbi:MAG: hypothetical protein ACRENL_00030 [Candidatus Dormibacteria bacterium]